VPVYVVRPRPISTGVGKIFFFIARFRKNQALRATTADRGMLEQLAAPPLGTILFSGSGRIARETGKRPWNL
jgi:hypothetical protein